MKNKITNDNKILILISVALIFLSGILADEIILALQVMLIFLTKKSKLPKKFILAILALTVHAVINIFFENETLTLMAKQIIGITISYMYYHNTIKSEEDVKDFFKIYLKFAIVIAIICIIQQIAFYLHIKFIYDLRWLVRTQVSPANTNYRASALFNEPSECALILFPAFFISAYNFIGKFRENNKDIIDKKNAIIIIMGFLLTFSSAGYIGGVIALFIIWKEHKHSLKQVFILLILVGVIIGLYNNVTDFKKRIDDTLVFLNDSDINIATINISSQTLIINERITFESLINTGGLGSGIGSHMVSYQKYIGGFNYENVKYFFNQQDANSLLLRLISELGIFGILIIVIFIKKYFVGKNNEKYSIYNKTCLTYFILRLLRYGHYFNKGMWAFIIIYMQINNDEKSKIGALNNERT